MNPPSVPAPQQETAVTYAFADGRPHILMTGANFTFVHDWAECARSIGQVTLAQSHRGKPRFEVAGTGSDQYLSVRQSVLRPHRVFGRLNSSADLRALDRALKDSGTPSVDVVHTHFYSGAIGAAEWAAHRGARLVHTEHSSAILERRVSGPGLRLLLRVCELADVVMAVSAPLADAMVDLGVRRPIDVVENPVNLGLFAPRPPICRSGVVSPTFISVGWLIERKAHRDLIEAFERVRAVERDARLLIVGDGPLRGSLEQLVESKALAQHVEFCGAVSRSSLAEHLRRADVYVHTSQSETFGVSLVEAWASGLPVVAFDCGGVSSEADAFGGRLVRSRNVGDLADAMLAVANSVSARVSSSIRARCDERFGSENAQAVLRRAYGAAPKPGATR
jgi:glycosyltransferase involved in cell wall biosynthesis